MTRDLSRRTELLKNNFWQSLHKKTTNKGFCPSMFALRRILLLVCCTAQNRVARRDIYPEGSFVHSKDSLDQGVHILYHGGLLHCSEYLWSGLSA